MISTKDMHMCCIEVGEGKGRGRRGKSGGGRLREKEGGGGPSREKTGVSAACVCREPLRALQRSTSPPRHRRRQAQYCYNVDQKDQTGGLRVARAFFCCPTTFIHVKQARFRASRQRQQRLPHFLLLSQPQHSYMRFSQRQQRLNSMSPGLGVLPVKHRHFTS